MFSSFDLPSLKSDYTMCHEQKKKKKGRSNMDENSLNVCRGQMVLQIIVFKLQAETLVQITLV